MIKLLNSLLISIKILIYHPKNLKNKSMINCKPFDLLNK
jgi:hypothetical protein